MSEKTSIQIKVKTQEILKSFKKYERMTYDDVINDLINLANKNKKKI